MLLFFKSAQVGVCELHCDVNQAQLVESPDCCMGSQNACGMNNHANSTPFVYFLIAKHTCSFDNQETCYTLWHRLIVPHIPNATSVPRHDPGHWQSVRVAKSMSGRSLFLLFFAAILWVSMKISQRRRGDKRGRNETALL